ncbi:MAG TPA: HEAT repeat domain-containing protein [Armatimonadota bacterium]|jgi:HEAT repeat protein
MRRDVRETLILGLCSTDTDMRRGAIAALDALDAEQAVPVVATAFARLSGQDKERALLAFELGRLRCAVAAPALTVRLTADPAETVRAMAAFALHCLGDPEALSALLQALTDSSAKVVISACAALEELGALRAVPSLLALLGHADWNVRLRAAIVLLNFGITDPRIPATLDALAHEPEAREYDECIAEAQLLEHLTGEKRPPHPQSIGYLYTRLHKILTTAHHGRQ